MDTWDSRERYSFVVWTLEKFNREHRLPNFNSLLSFMTDVYMLVLTSFVLSFDHVLCSIWWTYLHSWYLDHPCLCAFAVVQCNHLATYRGSRRKSSHFTTYGFSRPALTIEAAEADCLPWLLWAAGFATEEISSLLLLFFLMFPLAPPKYG